MRINTNIAAINAYRVNTYNNAASEKSLQKLSSGLRINKAGDDAAGLAISEKMRGQIRGLGQAGRNIQDGISLVQTAEGAMTEAHALVQRGRELAIQAANGTLTTEDRQNIQDEVSQIVGEIDRIADTTQFNTINLLNVASTDANKQQILLGLKSAWLQQAEQLVTNRYGLTADGVQLQINLVPGTPGGTLASVSGMVGGDGKWTNLNLNIEMADFAPGTLPNGDNSISAATGMYNDRIIAHEMVHAVMARTMNFSALPTWFQEGAAEFIHGADSRLWADSAGGTNFAAVEDEIASWEGTSIDYSAGYAAVKYMHAQIKAAGGTGIDEVMAYLNTNQSDNLDDALAAMQVAHGGLTFNSTATFIAQFDGGAGAAYMATLNLTDADTGAIGGSSDGGAALTDTSVVDDTVNLTDNPLTGFQELWPALQASAAMNIQVGANTVGGMGLSLVDIRSASIGLANVDVINQAMNAIGQFDGAIAFISTERSRLGAMQNRLEHALAVAYNSEENLTASESRIRDVDMAKEMMAFTKTNILGQASQAMLMQANQQPQAVLQLLRAG